MKKIYRALLIVSSVFYCHIQFANAQIKECCDDIACKAVAENFIKNIEKQLTVLGGCPSDFPERKNELDKYQRDKPASYERLKKATDKAYKWYINDLSRRKCFVKFYESLSEDALNWLEFLMVLFYPSDFRSPEFAKGFGSHIHANFGSIDVFKKTERYVLSGGALASYTFTPKGRLTGGHVRLMLGPSFYYSRQHIFLLVNPRTEFRIKDIGSDMASLGCLKLILQGNLGSKMQLGGMGVSLELASFAIDLTLDNDFKNKDYFIKLGMMYSKFFKKDK